MTEDEEKEINGAFSYNGLLYEVAQELLNDRVAHYSHVMALEMQKDTVDEKVIEDALQQQQKLFDIADSLRVDDRQAIDEVIKTYGQAQRQTT